MPDEDWKDSEALLRDWLRRSRESQHSHHEAGKFCRTVNYWLAVPVIVITTVLGTTAFASIEKQVSDSAKIWFGVVSLVAAVLAALQTHFQFSERSEKHKSLGARYGNIRREIEEVLSLPPGHRGDMKKTMARIRERLDEISAEGPVVSRRIFNRTVKILSAKRSSPVT